MTGLQQCSTMPRAPRYLCDAEGKGEFRYVELEVYECSCGFHLGVDASYLEQVEENIELRCPSCGIKFTTRRGDEQ